MSHPGPLVVPGYREAWPLGRVAQWPNGGNGSLRGEKTGTEGGREKLQRHYTVATRTANRHRWVSRGDSGVRENSR